MVLWSLSDEILWPHTVESSSYFRLIEQVSYYLIVVLYSRQNSQNQTISGLKNHTKEADRLMKKKEPKEKLNMSRKVNIASIQLTSNRYTALLEEENDQQQQKFDPVNTPKSPPIYVSGVITISPLIQPLEQILEKQ
jgi:hypothetical protein